MIKVLSTPFFNGKVVVIKDYQVTKLCYDGRYFYVELSISVPNDFINVANHATLRVDIKDDSIKNEIFRRANFNPDYYEGFEVYENTNEIFDYIREIIEKMTQ